MRKLFVLGLAAAAGMTFAANAMRSPTRWPPRAVAHAAPLRAEDEVSRPAIGASTAGHRRRAENRNRIANGNSGLRLSTLNAGTAWGTSVVQATASSSTSRVGLSSPRAL